MNSFSCVSRNKDVLGFEPKVPSHGPQSHTLDVSTIEKLARYLVSNTFVVNGGTLRKQTIGIPMGTNAAPRFATTFLYSYEAAYISRLIEEKKLREAKRFGMTFRLIDDVLSVDNPEFQHAISRPSEDGGLYPKALTLNQTSKSNLMADFVGMQSW